MALTWRAVMYGEYRSTGTSDYSVHSGRAADRVSCGYRPGGLWHTVRVDNLGLSFSIMTHAPDEGPVSRHIVMDDAEVRPGPTRLSLPDMLSIDGFWCIFTRYAPKVPLCPDCREWLRERHRQKVAAQPPAASIYEVVQADEMEDWHPDPDIQGPWM